MTLKILSALICGLIATVGVEANSSGLIPERRPDTVSTKPGYLVLPVYGQVPGLGKAYGLGAIDANVWGSRTDISFAGVTGDGTAAALDVSEVHLGDHLVFEFTGYYTRLTYQSFDRGILSDQNNYYSPLYVEYGSQGVAWLRFWERRIQMFAHVGPSRAQVYEVLSPSGNIFNNADNGTFDTLSTTYGAWLDLTDSALDPHEGLRLEANRDQQSNFDGLHSQFYDLNMSATAFIPVGRSTLALNYFRSSAFVTQQNNLSQAQLQQAMNLNCAGIPDPLIQAQCLQAQSERVQDRVTENQYGTAAALGGEDRLRGYVQNRFRGSQTQFTGAEFRWNLTEGSEPFNWGFLAGVRSNLQLAFFYELGSVTDPPIPIEEAPWRANYGAGLRLLFSGLAIRADVGFSNEGTQLTVFFGYPWLGSLL